MKRKLSLIVLVTCLLCVLIPEGSRAEKRGVLGAGIGVVDGVGGPVGDGNTSGQLFALHGFGLFGLNSWSAVIADITFGLPRTYNGVISGGESQKVELSAFFFDVMGGVYKTQSDGGYMYLAAGFSIATVNRDDTIADTGTVEVFKSDAGTSFGFSFGAGFGLPIREEVFGFVSLRHRFLTADVETTGPGFTSRGDVSIGGPEVTVGVAFGVGI